MLGSRDSGWLWTLAKKGRAAAAAAVWSPEMGVEVPDKEAQAQKPRTNSLSNERGEYRS